MLRDYQGNVITPPGIGMAQYEYDLYSGSQIGIMIGDVAIDMAVSIDWNVFQSKTPVYGYAHQYYTYAADGKVLVQGSLAIGFKEAGYLLNPIARFHRLAEAGLWTSPSYRVGNDGIINNSMSDEKNDGTLTSAARAAASQKIMRANVEQMMTWDAQSPGGAYRDCSLNSSYRDLAAMDDSKFEQWAEVFEDVIWYGSDTANQPMRDALFSGNISGWIADEDVLSHRRADQYPPVDIWITYGDFTRAQANHTVKKLLDVSFTGQGQSITVSGQATLEIYNFIARNIV
jgi:hypothetical protein